MLADAPALAEALFNLLDNAVAVSPIGGCVLLTTQELADGDQRWVIQDAGPGMQGEQLVAFGRPYRSTREGGSGLGVAIARAAIANHGGLLRVDSQAGSGTTMTVWLPRGSNALERCPGDD